MGNPTCGGSLYITKQLSIPFVNAVANVHWKIHTSWKWEPEREVPKVGDVGTLEKELPSIGLVKNSVTLIKYINTESYYEREYHFTSNFLPGVEGYIANMTVFRDAESPEKSVVVYRATWHQGEVSDTFKALMKGLIDTFEDPTPTTSLTSMNPTCGGSLYITKQLSIPFVNAVANVHWKIHTSWEWEPEREVPKVGDVGTLEKELPNIGVVKNSVTLIKYINTESYYEREYHFTSNFLPEVEGYIANMTVFRDAESPEKSVVVYRATWDQGEVSDMFKALMKGLIDSFEDPTPTTPLTSM